MFFFSIFNGFNVLISKIKKIKTKIIFIYFQAKFTFKKHSTLQYQIHSKNFCVLYLPSFNFTRYHYIN